MKAVAAGFRASPADIRGKVSALPDPTNHRGGEKEDGSRQQPQSHRHGHGRDLLKLLDGGAYVRHGLGKEKHPGKAGDSRNGHKIFIFTVAKAKRRPQGFGQMRPLRAWGKGGNGPPVGGVRGAGDLGAGSGARWDQTCEPFCESPYPETPKVRGLGAPNPGPVRRMAATFPLCHMGAVSGVTGRPEATLNKV